MVADDEVRFGIRVTPGARRPSVGGDHDGDLVVKVAARAADGKATDAALAAVANALGVARRDVTLVRGATSRRKLLAVRAPSPDVERRIDDLRAGGGPDARPTGQG